jgi:sterol 3beta-glucosyltransferase
LGHLHPQRQEWAKRVTAVEQGRMHQMNTRLRATKVQRVLLITVGSRGDAEPFCSLASSLVAAGAEVDLFLQRDLVHLAPPKVTCHPLPFTQQDFYRYTTKPSHGADHPNPRVRFVGVVADIIGELVLPCFEQVFAKAARVNSIVASSLARHLALLLAKYLDVPLYLVQLQPLVPTKDFPHFSRTDLCVEALISHEASGQEKYIESYIELERFQFEFLKEHLRKFVGGEDLDDFDRDILPMLKGESSKEIFMVNAVSEHLIPKASDAGTKVLYVGPLADSYIPSDWEPPEKLEEFLDGCPEPPVCVGFGSMPFHRFDVLLKALKRTNRPAILVGSSMHTDDHSESTPKTVYCIQSAPYAWLLPRCSMMLSHGGAGVLHATLRAGIPAVLSPFMGDQFLFAKLVSAKGIGVQACNNLTNLGDDCVVEAIRKADECKRACQEFGEVMRGAPNGAAALSAEILAVHSRIQQIGKI